MWTLLEVYTQIKFDGVKILIIDIKQWMIIFYFKYLQAKAQCYTVDRDISHNKLFWLRTNRSKTVG